MFSSPLKITTVLSGKPNGRFPLAKARWRLRFTSRKLSISSCLRFTSGVNNTKPKSDRLLWFSCQVISRCLWSPHQRYDFELSDPLSDFEMELYKDGWPCEILQIPDGSSETLETFFDTEKSIQVYGKSSGTSAKAASHKKFLQTISDDFPDWLATVAFYAAVEMVEQLLAERGHHGESHHDRKVALKPLPTPNAKPSISRPLQRGFGWSIPSP